MANGRFTAYVTGATAKRKKVVRAIFQTAAQSTTEEMQTPGPSVANPGGGAGGHMPISSGFLRASLQASLAGPVMPTQEPPTKDGKYTYDAGQVSLVIASADLTDKITVSYGARYARYMENRYGFVRLSAQNWRKHVAEATAKAQAKLGL